MVSFEGIIIIDAQRTISTATELANRVKTLSKPVLGILLTHTHPDHFGGLAVLKQEFPNAPIFASTYKPDLQIVKDFMETKKKVAVITGSYKGLGLAIARKLALIEDIQVIITSRQESDSEATKKRLEAEDIEVDRHQLDITDGDSITLFMEWVTSAYGRVDILINNAGVNPAQMPEEASILTATAETMLKTFSTNTVGALRMCQAVIPLMQQRGYGRIVNVSTEMASLQQIPQDFYPIAPSYRVSKVGLNAIATSLAKELKDTNILVNNYSPGWMKTDIGGEDAPYTPEEGAETAVYLATLPDEGSQAGFFAEMRKFGGAVALPW